MAQTGYTPILIYSSSTAAAAPAAGSLTNSTLGSELAINITDGKLFYKDNANAVQVIGWKTVPTTAGGTGLTSYTAGDLTYYASGTTLTKLAIGSNTTVLTSSGTAPQWTAQSSLSVGTASNLLSNATTGVMQITGPSAGTTRVMTIPDANFTAARTDAAQNFIGNNTFDTTLLVIDATNDRVGVGTGTPVTRFEARGVDAIARFRGSSTQYLDIIATAGGTVALDANNGALALSVNTVERARFFSSGGVSIGNTTDPGATNLSVTGSVGIGQTIAAGKLHVRQDQNGVTRSIIQNRNGSGTPISELTFLSGAFDLSDDRYAYIQSAGGNVPYIDFGTSNGAAPVTRVRISAAGETLCGGTTDNGAYNLQCNGTAVWGAGAYVNGSDARIKEDIAAIDSGLDVVAKLNPVTYRYKTDWSNDQTTQTGFIAQELLVAMEGKNYAEGVVQQGGANSYYSVAYQNIIPILTKAIQEQQALIDELTVRLASIEEKI